MNKRLSKNLLVPLLLAGGFIVLDVVADRLVGGGPDLDFPHLILAAGVLLISFAILERSVDARRRSEAALRQVRDDLEIRVRERTAELEQTNEALRQATQRWEHLSSFPRLNPNPVMEIDAAEAITYCNSAATQALAKLGVENDCRPFFPDDMAGILQELDQEQEGGLQREVQVGSAIFGEMIQVLPAFGTVRIYAFDMTERRRAEAALRESEEKFATVFRLSPDAIGILRARDETVLDVNAAFAALLGCERSEIIGKTWDELEIVQAAAQRDILADLFAREGKVTDHELDFTTQEGSVLTLLITLSTVAIRGEQCTLAIAHDITERKRAEEALRSAQLQAETEKRHLEAVLEALPVGVVITDAQGGIVLTNGMDEQIWGPRPITRGVDDYVQYQAWWADSGKRVETHEWASAQAVQNGESVFGQVLEIQSVDGGRGFILNSAVPIRDGEGRVIGSAVAIQDITELRRAEQALRDSEERFRTVVGNSRDGITMLDLETGRYVFMSPAQMKLTGFSAEELRGLSAEEANERVHPDDREISLLQQKEIAAGRNQGTSVEYRWQVKSGEYRWFSDSRTVVLDEQGRAIALVGVSRDITEQKRTEAELARIAQQRELALDAAHLGWWHYDPITQIASWDDRYRDIFGVTGYTCPNEILARIIHPEDWPGLWAKMEASLDPVAPQPFAAEYRINRPDGALRWIEAHGIASFGADGENRVATSFVGTVADITERKQMEVALRESENGLKKAQEIAHLGSWELDLVTDRLSWSDEVYRIFGLQPQQFGATYQAFLEAIHPDDRAAVDAAYSGSIRDGKDNYQIEHRVVKRSSGEVRIVREKCDHFRNEGGQIIRSVGMVHDITEQKQAEEALRASEEKYRLLFQNMAEGFALYELLFDEQGSPADWRVLEVNDAYTRHTGVTRDRIVGRRLSELFPEAIPEYLPRFAAVVATQTPSDFETYAKAVDRYQHVATFPAGGHRFASIIDDVTERRRAEQRLGYQASLLANISDVVYATDVQLRITSWNRAAEMAFGWKEQEALGKSLVEITGWKSDPEMRAGLARKISDEGSVTTEIEHTTKSGQPIIFDSNVMLLRDAGGEVVGFVAVNRDITQRKRAEQDLRNALAEMQQRQAEIAALFAGSRAVLEQRTFEGAARLVFDACKSSVGAAAGYIGLMTDDGAQNQPVVLDAGDRPCALDPSLPMPIRGLLAQAYRTGQVVYENDFASSEWVQLLPEGHACLDNVLLAPLTIEGKVAGLLGLANKAGGFSEHDAHLAGAFAELAAIALVNSRAVESLEHSEERFRSVVQADNDAIITCDSHAMIAFWNNAAERVFGYSASEITGQPLARILPSHIRQFYEENILHAFASGKSAMTGQTVESSGLRKDGAEFATEVSLTNWRTKEGLFFTVNIRDISERKRSEERLRRVQLELALGLQERAALEERQRLARELHDSVSQALYGISLGANTALALFEVDRTKVLDALSYVLSLAQTGLMEMRALIFELRPESLEMEGLATALTKQARALAGRHGIEVVLSLCDEPDAPLTVKEALYRIAQEALQNAIKHARPDRLDVRLTCEDGGLSLEVCDNGVGFDPHAVYRGHLGLHSMRERATKVGGTLTISSDPDCGTQVRVDIPVPVVQAV